jgi:hypothetical protein
MEQEIDDEESERQRQFRRLQDRRRSAPDIHRRGLLTDRLVMVSHQKGTSSEQINSERIIMYNNIANRSRKLYNSTGKLFFYYRIKMKRFSWSCSFT